MKRSSKKQKNLSPMNDTFGGCLHKNLEFGAIEQYKLLRANLDFTVPEGTKCPIVGVTSSMRGEGKSTTSINLSYVLAEKGSRVLLIDADLRIPSVAKKMGISGSYGLTDMLMGRGSQDIEQFKSSVLDKWYVMPSGEIPPNPSELLGSKRMETLLDSLKEQFDYIIVDLPPINVVSDALSLAGFITGIVLVIREGYTEKKELEKCFRQLGFSGVNVLGCIMNETRVEGFSRRNRRGRYYRYYYESEYRVRTGEK